MSGCVGCVERVGYHTLRGDRERGVSVNVLWMCQRVCRRYVRGCVEEVLVCM